MNGTRDVSGPGRALPSLTGLRFAAALLVLGFHLTLSSSPVPPNLPVNPFADDATATTLEWLFSKAGYLGVSFFFVLSGFVLTWSATPGERMRAFWRRRLLKIFPNHLVLFALAMVAFAGATTPVSAWLPNLFLLHSFSPDADVYVSVNPPAWTLCSELLFYLLFPLIIDPIRRIPGHRLWLALGATVLGMAAVCVVNQFLIPAVPLSPIVPVSTTQFWFGYIFPPTRLFEFVAGMVLARIVAAGLWPRIGLWQAGAVAAAGYAVALAVPFLYGFTLATIVGVIAVIGAFATADVRGVRTGFGGRRARWLGEISFGFYICQGVVVFYGRTLFGPEPFPTPVALLVAAALAATALVSGWLLFTCVERPVMRRWARPRRPAAPPAPVAPDDVSAAQGRAGYTGTA